MKDYGYVKAGKVEEIPFEIGNRDMQNALELLDKAANASGFKYFIGCTDTNTFEKGELAVKMFTNFGEPYKRTLDEVFYNALCEQVNEGIAKKVNG